MSDRRFLLVHGTWAHGKWRALLWRFIPEHRRPTEIAWPDLAAKLKTLGRVEHFVWSGKNSHKARTGAGQDLAKRIKKILGDHRDEQLCIVSHSHGGNVALYALDALSEELRKRVNGLVCLATPFLHFRPQQLDTSVFWILPLVAGFLLFGVLFITWMLGWLYLDVEQPILQVAIVLLGSASSLLLVFWLFQHIPGKKALKKLPGKISKYCKSAQPPAPEGTRVLLMRKEGDEAAAALGGGRLMELVLAGLWRVAGAPLIGLNLLLMKLAGLKLIGRIVATALIIAAGIVAYQLLGRVIDVEKEPILGWAIMIFIGLVVGIALVQTVLGLLIALVNVLRFGWTAVTTTPFVRVTSEPTPKGTWQVTLYRVIDATGRAHSEIYEDPDVIRDICAWVE